eukprot:gene42474-52677_t
MTPSRRMANCSLFVAGSTAYATTHSVALPVRSMYIMTGDSRYKFTHGVKSFSSYRVSLTF